LFSPVITLEIEYTETMNWPLLTMELWCEDSHIFRVWSKMVKSWSVTTRYPTGFVLFCFLVPLYISYTRQTKPRMFFKAIIQASRHLVSPPLSHLFGAHLCPSLLLTIDLSQACAFKKLVHASDMAEVLQWALNQ
jgi:hypothetical protein